MQICITNFNGGELVLVKMGRGGSQPERNHVNVNNSRLKVATDANSPGTCNISIYKYASSVSMVGSGYL
jgi:hypothetical protein